MRDLIDGVRILHVDSGDRFRDPGGRNGQRAPELREEVRRELRSHRLD
jgi:hypothetical protein